MAEGPVERSEERKRVASIYCHYRIEGQKKWGFLKPDPVRGLIVNLSKSGMGVRVSGTVEPGQILDLSVQLPTQREPLEMKAKVLWVREQRKLGTVTYTHIFGAQFIEYSPEAWRAIQAVMDE